MAIALVLGAGGVVGRAYAIGTLAALDEAAGWDARTASLIVGTSAGAGTGATLRLGLSSADHRRRLLGEPLSAEGHALVGDLDHITEFAEPEGPRRIRERRPQAPHLVRHGLRRPLPTGLGIGISGLLPRGTIPITPLGDKLRVLYGDTWPAAPLWVCAVRVRDGARVVFGREPAPGRPGCPPLATAVEASSAIPGYFEPVEIGGERYLDGAAHSSTNADLLAGLAFDGVVVISPMSAVGEALRWHPRWVSRAGYHKVLGLEVDEVEASGTPVLVFEPTPDDLALMGGDALDARSEALVVERARATATQRLQRLGISDLARSWGR